MIVGPFRISCKINKQTIYWRAEEERQQVVGTDSKANASLFFITPTEDSYRPFEFFLTHCKKEEVNQSINMHMSSRKLQHVASNSNIFGYSSQPLDLTLTQQTRFSLHEQTQPSLLFMMCPSSPVIPSEWIEGEEFYIKCNQSSFEVDRYVAMKRLHTPSDAYTYSTQTVSMKDPAHSKDVGMLFRLSKKYRQPQPTASNYCVPSFRQVCAAESSSGDESWKEGSTYSSSSDTSQYETVSEGEDQNQAITALEETQVAYPLPRKEHQPQVSTEQYFEEEDGGHPFSSLSDFSSINFEGEFQPKYRVSTPIRAQNEPLTTRGEIHPNRTPQSMAALRQTQPPAPLRETQPTAVLGQTQPPAALRETQPIAVLGQFQPIALPTQSQLISPRRRRDTRLMTTHREIRSTAARGEYLSTTEGTQPIARPASNKPRRKRSYLPVSIANTYAERYEQLFGYND